MRFNENVQFGKARYRFSRLFLENACKDIQSEVLIPQVVRFDDFGGMNMEFCVFFHELDENRLLAKSHLAVAMYPFSQRTKVVHAYVARLQVFLGISLEIFEQTLFPRLVGDYGIVNIDYLTNFRLLMRFQTKCSNKIL